MSIREQEPGRKAGLKDTGRVKVKVCPQWGTSGGRGHRVDAAKLPGALAPLPLPLNLVSSSSLHPLPLPLPLSRLY